MARYYTPLLRLVPEVFSEKSYEFITKNGNSCCDSKLRANKVCKYWRDKHSIFITHFIHPGDGTKESIILSRTRINKIWIDAYTRGMQIRQITNELRLRYGLTCVAAPGNDIETERYNDMCWYNEIMATTAVHVSTFLELVTELEAKSQVPTDWFKQAAPKESEYGPTVSTYLPNKDDRIPLAFQAVLQLERVLLEEPIKASLEWYIAQYPVDTDAYLEPSVLPWVDKVDEITAEEKRKAQGHTALPSETDTPVRDGETPKVGTLESMFGRLFGYPSAKTTHIE